MNTDPAPKGFVALSATDRDLCDRLRAIDERIAALEPQDAALYELVAERREIQQMLIFNRKSRKAK